MMEIPDPDKQNVQIKVENDLDDYLVRKREIVFEKGVDVTLRFENGESIHINKSLLALQSKYFFDVFFGSLHKEVQIKDFDRETFQTFLNCLFGLKEYSALDALLIYPIAVKYGVDKCLRKCISILKPTEMNENVCLTLNLALFYEREGLVNDIMQFLENQVGVINVMENKDYWNVIEPKTMSKLIDCIDLDSYVWEIIYEWGKYYLGNRTIKKDVRLFFTENDIFKKLSLSNFESAQCIFDFHKLNNKQLLDSDEILDYLENNIRKKNDEKIPEKSCWLQVEKGEEITETIVFKNAFVVSSENSKKDLTLNIWINRIYPKLPKEMNSNIINCKARYKFRNMLSKKDINHDVFPVSSTPSTTCFSTPSTATGFGTSLNNSIFCNDPLATNKGSLFNTSSSPTGLFGTVNTFGATQSPYGSILKLGKKSSKSAKKLSFANNASSTVTPFSFSSIHEIKKKISSPSPKKLSFPVNLPHEFSEIKSVEITYTFSFDCRILKTSISENFVDSDQLYFTKDVSYPQN